MFKQLQFVLNYRFLTCHPSKRKAIPRPPSNTLDPMKLRFAARKPYRALCRAARVQEVSSLRDHHPRRTFPCANAARVARVHLDAAGRLLVPEKLKAAVGIEREVAMVGVAHRAEIWPREAWEKFESSNANDGLDELHTILCSPPGGDGDASTR